MLAGLLPSISEKILSKVFPSDEDKAKKLEARARLVEAEQKGEFIELETRMQAIVMEAKSKDPWTSRARPSFLYVMYLMILASIPMGVVQIFAPVSGQEFIEGFKGWLEAIPVELWGLFGAGYLGYVNKRSQDKALILGHKPDAKGLLGKILG
jgi:hypothetical protein